MVIRDAGEPLQHELGHLVLGDEYSNDLGVHASRPDRENVIDEFAAEFLLPSPVLASIGANRVSRGQLVEVAARCSASRGHSRCARLFSAPVCWTRNHSVRWLGAGRRAASSWTRSAGRPSRT